MGRTVDLEQWRASQRVRTRLMAQLAGTKDRKRRRPRDPVEARLLERSAVAAVARRKAEGRLVRFASRRYELRVK